MHSNVSGAWRDDYGADLPDAGRAEPLLELAVVIPTLDERDNIAPLLAGLRKALAGIAHEVIFVDDASRDGTPELIAAIGRGDHAIRLIRRYGRRGLSSAVTEGAMATTAPVVAVMDADGQHDESILPRLFEVVARGSADVAVATRYAAGGSIGDLDRRRSFISRLATRMAATVVGTRLSDPMSGFFVVRQSSLQAALPHLSGTGFKILLDLLASTPEPLRVAELPYRFRARHAGTSKLDSTVAMQFLAMLIDKRLGHVLPIRLLMFVTVGALGLAVHLTILNLLLLRAGTSFNTAQASAVVTAMTFNFFLNNAFTYRDRRLHGAAIVRGLATFYLICGLGALANIGLADLVYSTQRWWVAGIAGATIGALWNFTATSIFTWKRS
jgi:dolichol-phosphate mannosyltransferase